MGLPMQFAQGYGGGNSYRGSGGGYRPQPRPNPYAVTTGGINPYRTSPPQPGGINPNRQYQTSPPQSAPQQDPRMSWEAPNMKPPSGPRRSIEPIKQPVPRATQAAQDPRFSEEARKQREAARKGPAWSVSQGYPGGRM